MVTINKQIAVEPFKTRSNQLKIASGFAESATRDALIPLKALFSSADSFEVREGATVYVRAELSLSAMAKKLYEVEGVQFILIPLDQIVMVKAVE